MKPGDVVRTLAFYARVLPLLAVPPVRRLAALGGTQVASGAERALLRLGNRLFSKPIPIAPYLSRETYYASLDLADCFTLARRLGLADDWTRGLRVLDAGCGHGKLSLELARRGAAQITGLDIAASSIAFAVQRAAQEHIANVRFEVGSIYALPYADGEFEAAVSMVVFEHLDNVAQALAEVHRVLAPGARFLFNIDSFRARYGAHLGHFVHTPWPLAFFSEACVTAHWQYEAEKLRCNQPGRTLPDYFDFSNSLPSLNRLTMTDVDRLVADTPFELERSTAYADEKMLLALLPWQRIAPRAYEWLRGSKAYLLRKRP